MTEKVLHEVRFIETEDGFRIEVKGDKEKIRQMGFGPGLGMMGFDPGMHLRRHLHGRHRHHHHPLHRHGAKGWGWWWDDMAEVDDEEYEKPPKQV